MAASLSHSSRGAIQQRLLPEELESWPSVDPVQIPDARDRTRFNHIDRGITRYAHGGSLRDAALTAHLDQTWFCKLVQKARSSAPDGRPWGYRAFVRGAARKAYSRDASLSCASVQSGSGLSGAFGKLLRVRPSICRGLIEFLNQRKRNAIVFNKASWQRLHIHFLGLCRAAGIGEHEYPLGTQTQARSALRQWVKTVYVPANVHTWIEKNHSPEAAHASQSSTGDATTSPPMSPYCIWELDEYTIDVIAQYELLDDHGNWVQIVLDRFQCIVCVAPDSGATLAWAMVLGRQTDVASLMEVLWRAMSGQPAPKMLIPNLIDVDGAGYPSVVFEELTFAAPRRINLDNALAHLAKDFHTEAQGRWGARVTNGTAATPQERASVESHIGQLAKRLMRELPGATGAHPRDSLRSRSKSSATHRLDVDLLEAAIDSFFRNRNAEPARASHYSTPLQKIRQQLLCGAIRLNHLPSSQRRAHLFFGQYKATIKAALGQGRMPYVNFQGCRYTSPELRKRIDLIDKKFHLKVDKDLRNVYLYDPRDGTEVMTLHAEGEWGKIPHSLRFRRLAKALARRGYLNVKHHDHLISAVLNYLRSEAPTDKLRATQLAEFMFHVRDHMTALPEPFLEMYREYIDLIRALDSSETLAGQRPVPKTAAEKRAQERATKCEQMDADSAMQNVIVLRPVRQRRVR